MNIRLTTTLCSLAAPFLILPVHAAPQPSTLRNERLQISIDDEGRLVSLKNLETGRDYAGRDYLWRLYYDTPKAKEIEVLAAGQQPRISQNGETITLLYEELKATDFSIRKEVTLDISLRFDITLEGDQIRFASKIENNEPHTIVRELHYPLVGNMPLPEPKVDKLLRWKPEPKPKKGYYIAKIVEGINPVTGFKYRRYTMIRLTKRKEGG